MTSPYHQPRLPGEFRVAGGFGRMAAPFIVVLVFVFLILVLLGSVGTRSVAGGIGIGRPQVCIPLGGIDPQWQYGAMGVWLRRYRPDLLPPSW